MAALQRRPAARELETPSGNSVWSPPDSAGLVLTVNVRQKQWLQNLSGYLYPFTTYDCDLSDDDSGIRKLKSLKRQKQAILAQQD